MFDVIPINGETWLICGGRDFADDAMFNGAMGDIIRLFGMPSKVVHGGARGADTMAGRWAQRYAISVAEARAEWDKHSRAAGPIRNQRMLDEHKPQKVIAFPGGKGTADMVERARKTQIDVIEIRARQSAPKEE